MPKFVINNNNLFFVIYQRSKIFNILYYLFVLYLHQNIQNIMSVER